MAVYAPGHCLLVDARKAQRPEGCWQVALMKTKDTLTLNPKLQDLKLQLLNSQTASFKGSIRNSLRVPLSVL